MNHWYIQRGRTSQGVNQPGTGGERARSEQAKGRMSQGANRPGANRQRGEKAIIPPQDTVERFE